MSVIKSAAPAGLAQPGAERFEQLAAPLRREIKLHCYRMLGSTHEAEDLVQETYLRAWTHFRRLEAQSAFRPWLYRIATNACLTALARRKGRRILPDRHSPATHDMPDGARATEVPWLEPYPDSALPEPVEPGPSPEAHYAARESVQLAFMAVIQQLPPRQRAVLLLCEVLGWSATETAGLLGGSVASINSALQRARATLNRLRQVEGTASAAPPDAAQQALLDRYLAAWDRLDLDGFTALLKADAIYTMPPTPQWYQGRSSIGAFFAWAWPRYRGFRLVPTRANGQPAFAAYARTDGDAWSAHALHVLTVDGGQISRLTFFLESAATPLFPLFDLPQTLVNG